MWIRIASLLSLALLVSLPAPADEYGLAELEVLLQAREFFQLRDRLQELDATSEPPPRLLFFTDLMLARATSRPPVQAPAG